MRKVSISIFFILSWSLHYGQTIPPLERQITISFQDENIDVVLSRLSKGGNFTFSYSPSILDANQIVTQNYSDKSVREILNSLFKETVKAKTKGNYIILTKAPAPPKKESEDRSVSISGYVFDASTEDKIAETSVYDKKTLTAVVTDQYGFFKILVDNPAEETILSFSKRNFLDTLITVQPGSTQFISIGLQPEYKPAIVSQATADTVEIIPSVVSVPSPLVIAEMPSRKKRSIKDFFSEKIFSSDIFSRKRGSVNVANISDTIYRGYQVSLVPFVGTNHKLSGNVVNKYSFNVWGGYSMGTSIVEVGGIFNIDRGDVEHAQIAGSINAVGGKTTGVQMAGLANLTRRKVNATQFAGLFNANLDSLKGAQLAGLFNVNGRASQGAQFAGLFNVQPSFFGGVQAAGLLNVATHQMKGAQISGLLNFAHNIEGAQVGLINYADSIKGIPVGFLSFVTKGYHKIEVSADEIFYVNASFRSGVRQFYNIFTAGIKPEQVEGVAASPLLTPVKENVWTFGYGVGTAPKITKWLSLNFDVTANHVNQGSFTNSISLLSKLYLGFDFQITKKFSIAAGATLNGYLYDPDFTKNPKVFTNYTPHFTSEDTFTNGDILNTWWGWKVGLRFL